MGTKLAANLSILFTVSMLLLSFSFGFSQYSNTEKAIVSDLNQALQQALMRNSKIWMDQDTVQTYYRLSSIFGNPISIGSYNKDFSDALSYTLLKDKTGIIIRVKNPKEQSKVMEIPVHEGNLATNYLASDTIIWVSGQVNLAGTHQKEIGITFQGYANCSLFTVLALTNKTWPLLFFFLALISGTFSIYMFRNNRVLLIPTTDEERTVPYGNLTLSCDKACFYKENQQKLKLTPQQFTLMEMFFSSPVRMLTRTEICEVLWPGKANGDETLNTLIRRLRPLIEENSNLKITTDRGRAYILEIKDAHSLSAENHQSEG